MVYKNTQLSIIWYILETENVSRIMDKKVLSRRRMKHKNIV